MTRSFVHLCIVFTCAHAAFAGSAQKSEGQNCLWAVKGPSSTVYLQGSIHFLKGENYPLNPQIEKTFNSCETVVFEVDMGEMNSPEAQALMMSRGVLSEGKTLKDVLSAETYTLVQTRLEELGLGAREKAVFQTFKPWLLSLTLLTMELQKLGYTPEHGLDLYFYSKALEEKKETLGLETLDFQIGLLDEFSGKDQDAQLAYGIHELDMIEEQIPALVKAWESGESKKIEELLNESLKEFPDVYKSLLTDRNADWLPKIEKHLQGEHDVMVVVGAGHLVGKDSLIALLRKKGYAIRQL